MFFNQAKWQNMRELCEHLWIWRESLTFLDLYWVKLEHSNTLQYIIVDLDWAGIIVIAIRVIVPCRPGHYSNSQCPNLFSHMCRAINLFQKCIWKAGWLERNWKSEKNLYNATGKAFVVPFHIMSGYGLHFSRQMNYWLFHQQVWWIGKRQPLQTEQRLIKRTINPMKMKGASFTLTKCLYHFPEVTVAASVCARLDISAVPVMLRYD